MDGSLIKHSRYSESLQVARSMDGIPVGARFSASVQTGLGAQPASYKIGTGSLCRGGGGGLTFRVVALTTHPYLAPRFKKSAELYLHPLQGLYGLF
jgi:hypothetical protein